MKPPLFVGPLTDQDKQQLEAGLRSPDAFTLRRGKKRGRESFPLAACPETTPDPILLER
jgi:hypothetical protein